MVKRRLPFRSTAAPQLLVGVTVVILQTLALLVKADCLGYLVKVLFVFLRKLKL